jgi:hypothetical protein
MDVRSQSSSGLAQMFEGLSPGERLLIASTFLLASGALTIASGGTLAPGLVGAWQAIGLIGGVHGAALGVAGLGISIAGAASPQGINANTLKAYKSTVGLVMSPLSLYRGIESQRKFLAPRPNKIGIDWFQAISAEVVEQLLLEPQGKTEPPATIGPLGQADSVMQILESAAAAAASLEAARYAIEHSRQSTG